MHPADDLNKHFSHPDFINVLNKLEHEKAAKFISLPTDQTYLKYQIKILPGFDAYHKKLWADAQYRDWSGDKYPPKGLEPHKGYFDEANEVDFSLSKEENENKYLTVRKIAELYGLPKAERERIFKENLTSKQTQEIIDLIFKYVFNEFTTTLGDLQISPELSNQALAIQPDNEAESVNLLRQLVAANNEQIKPDASLTSPTYLRDDKKLIFCNQIIDVAKGKDYALLCGAMFIKNKPKNKPQQIGDLLDKWQEPDHKNSKRVHNAVNNFNNFIAKSTTVGDLFYIENKHVHFNPKYV